MLKQKKLILPCLVNYICNQHKINTSEVIRERGGGGEQMNNKQHTSVLRLYFYLLCSAFFWNSPSPLVVVSCVSNFFFSFLLLRFFRASWTRHVSTVLSLCFFLFLALKDMDEFNIFS